MPEMHVGVFEMGATDAWYEVLTTLEDYKLKGKHFVGGVADIAKIFDQDKAGTSLPNLQSGRDANGSTQSI